MKVRDIVELALRLVGVAFLYSALTAVPVAIGNFCPVIPYFNWKSLFPSLILVGWPLAVGLYLISGAPWLMRRAFKEHSTPGTTVKPDEQFSDLFKTSQGK